MGKRARKERRKQQQLEKKKNKAQYTSSDGEEDLLVSDDIIAVKCQHLKHVAPLFTTQVKSTNLKVCDDCAGGSQQKRKHGKQNKRSPWQELKSNKPEDLWVCLTCAKVFCKDVGSDHHLDHIARYPKHSLHVNIKSQNLWCATCRENVPVDPKNPSFESVVQAIETIAYILGKSSTTDTTDDSSKFFSWKVPDAGEKEEKKTKTEKSDEEAYEELVKTGMNLDGVKGLKNLGNTCFFNSIMQNITQTVPLRERFVVRADGTPAPKRTEGPLTRALREFMLQMWLGSSKTFSPSALLGQIGKRAKRFLGRQQQDAHELLRYLLDGLSTEEKQVIKILRERIKLEEDSSSEAVVDNSATQETTDSSSASAQEVAPEPTEAKSSSACEGSERIEETSSQPDSANKSETVSASDTSTNDAPQDSAAPSTGADSNNQPQPAQSSLQQKLDGILSELSVEDIFGGEFESRVTCHVCGTRSVVHEPFLDLSLPIPPSMLSEKLRKQLEAIEEMNQRALKKMLAKAQQLKNSGHANKSLSKKQKRALRKQQAAAQAAANSNNDETPTSSDGANKEEGNKNADVTEVANDTTDTNNQKDDSGATGESTTSNEQREPSATTDKPENENTANEIEASQTDTDTETKEESAENAQSDETEADDDADESQNDDETVVDTADVERAKNIPLYDGRSVVEKPKSCSVEGCLYAFTEPELLAGENAFACYNCTKQAWIASGKDLTPLIKMYGTKEEKEALGLTTTTTDNEKPVRIELLKRPATKQILIRKQPRVLTLHLKRFMQLPSGNFKKIDTMITFPTILDLTPYTINQETPTTNSDESSAAQCQQTPRYKYQLYGIVNHMGGMGGGHYVAFCRKRPLKPPSLDDDLTDSWYYASDTHLSKTTLNEVLSQEAYVLFYDRVEVKE